MILFAAFLSKASPSRDWEPRTVVWLRIISPMTSSGLSWSLGFPAALEAASSANQHTVLIRFLCFWEEGFTMFTPQRRQIIWVLRATVVLAGSMAASHSGGWRKCQRCCLGLRRCRA